MPYESYWVAEEPAIGRDSLAGSPGPAELGQLRELLGRLALVQSRAQLLAVIARCAEETIGAATVGLFERCTGRGVTTLLWSRGDEALLRGASRHPRVRETLRYGTRHAWHPALRAPAASPSPPEPVACIPLWGMGGNVCGALVLAELFPPKCQLDRQDRRILTLLASEVGRLLCTLPPDDRAEGIA